MIDRRKMTELLRDILDYILPGHIPIETVERVADQLIANGVTFAADNKVGCTGEVDFDYAAEDC